MKTDRKPVGKTQSPAAKRMAAYRARMRAQGLRPVQMWLPDTRSPEFIEKCRRQSLAAARHDPAGDEIMREIIAGQDWLTEL
jgi:Protein  of unknown function (DUF3018)